MTRYLSVFTNRRMLISLLLGFSSGLPLALIGSTLQAWLTEAQIDIATIGQFALVGLPYAMKFLWAPLLDNVRPPFLGLRRGWLAITQVGLCAATLGLAVVDPASGIAVFSFMAMLVAFFSASQDIVVDAYRTELIPDQAEVGAGAATYIAGYRLATVVSGGAAMAMADHWSWTAVYVSMAILNLIGLVTVLFAPEPAVTRRREFLGFREAVAEPFTQFFQRRGAMEILIFIMIYKLSTLMATALTTKFLLELGYSKTMIGGTNKVAGLIATISGTLVGGSLMMRLGLKRSLWIFGVVQAAVGISFYALNHLVVSRPELKDLWLVSIVSMDNFMMGMGTAALTGFMMAFATGRFTGTQYALLTSVMAVTRVILVAHAGTLVAWMGWNWFFIATVPLAIPGLLLLARFDQWQTDTGLHARVPRFDLGLAGVFVLSLIALASDPIWQALGLKESGQQAVLVGAAGVVAVVVLGLARPYLGRASAKAPV